MLYYGDRRVRVGPAEVAREVAGRWARLARSPPGDGDRASAIAALLVDAGMLAQGLADVAFERRGFDAPDRAADAAMRACHALGVALVAALESDPGPRVAVAAALADLCAAPLPAELAERIPEGFAHYAVHPEAYVAAARGLATAGPWKVVGIRSIGTALGAAVAAALDARGAVTVRPHGHPWDRRISLAPALESALLDDAAASFAVVDEGPGLSGSSFVSVVRALEALGVARSRIRLFPSHRGEPGPAASAGARTLWASVARHVQTFDDLARAGARAWVTGAVPDAAAAEVEDLSGGAWRSRAFASESAWPPVFAQQERRKLLFTTASGRWIAEFAGLGRMGERRLARARALAAAGFAVPPEALRRGLLVRRWIEAVPLDRRALADPAERRRVAEHVARYLAYRATAFPAPAGAGASLDELAEMLAVNAAESLGDDARAPAERLAALARARGACARRVEVDSKLERWEWLRTPDGRLLKADAVQHADGHDLVGAQDIGWDLAGAALELDLAPDEREELVRRVERASGERVAPELLAFHAAAYPAFRLARWTFALASEQDAAERGRIEREVARYRAALAGALSGARRG